MNNSNLDFLNHIEWTDVMPNTIKLNKKINKSSSYVNNNGQHPEIGKYVRPSNVVFCKKDMEDHNWFIIDTDDSIRNDINTAKVFNCPILITEK